MARKIKEVEQQFKVIEKRGGLPYVVMWIGKHHLPSIQHFSTLKDANAKVEYLEQLNIAPTLLLDLSQTDLYN